MPLFTFVTHIHVRKYNLFRILQNILYVRSRGIMFESVIKVYDIAAGNVCEDAISGRKYFSIKLYKGHISRKSNRFFYGNIFYWIVKVLSNFMHVK